MTDAKPKPKRTRKPVALSHVIATVAERKGRDTTATGKRVRNYVRSHDAELRKAFNWPPKQKVARDGNRYDAMPAKCAKHIIDTLS
jgi:hypothetical protein